MRILTLQGTESQITNLLNLMSDFDEDRLPTIKNYNTSERQLKDFLKFKSKGGFNIKMKLKGQGDNSISPAPINLCTVTIDKNEYYFGGISEPFYDKMVARFHDEN